MSSTLQHKTLVDIYLAGSRSHVIADVPGGLSSWRQSVAHGKLPMANEITFTEEDGNVD